MRGSDKIGTGGGQIDRNLHMEALERFVAKEPLRRTHECVFGILALESEAVDPRLCGRSAIAPRQAKANKIPGIFTNY